MENEESSTREEFENCFFYFLKALRVLSHDPDTQCREMENYNTGWEIQREVAGRGLGSLRLSAPYLSWEQAEKMVDLIAGVRRLPKEAIAALYLTGTNHIGCITAMNHPAWAPLRKEAEQLLILLMPAIKKNEEYFQA